MKTFRIKNTLFKVALAVEQGGKFSYLLADWLDDFYYQPNREMLEEEPCLFGDHIKDALILNAYLAATASQLCKQQGWTLPLWVWGPERILAKPWFAEKHEFLRATLLLESPGSFRERNLFVSANALTRV